MKHLFAKILGKSIPTSGITELRLSSTGMSSNDCFSVEVKKNYDEIFARIEKVPEENSVSDKLTARHWRILMEKISGHAYVRPVKKFFAGMISDGGEQKCTIIGKDSDPKREIDLSPEEFMDLKKTIDRFVKYKNPLDAHNIIGIEISVSGDMEGGSSLVCLERRKTEWFVVNKSRPYNGAKETVTETKVDRTFLDKAIDIIKGYDLQSMKDLPQSETEVLDAGTGTLSFTFEPFEHFSISETQELSDEASEMWGRISRLLKSM